MAVFRAFQPSPGFRRLFIFLPPVLVLVAVIGLVLFIDRPRDDLALDQHLCPIDAGQISERAVFLFDLRKPLDLEYTSLPGNLLKEVAMGLDTNAELNIFALGGSTTAPRIPLDYGCKPYADADLTADGATLGRGCDDLSAGPAGSVSERATAFCAWRATIQERLDELVVRHRDTPVGATYLVEAIEDTILEFAETSGPRSLYIFSDMMQHATWHSQPEEGVEDVGVGEPPEVSAVLVPLSHAVDDLRVKVFYVPRRGVTEDERARNDHKDFWREYFADFSGAGIEFEDQPPMASYEAASLAGEPTEIERAARERELLRLEREEIERALAEVEKDRLVLEAARKRAAEERQARVEREAWLRRQQEVAQAREAEQEAERRRLEAEQQRLESERMQVERRVAEASAARSEEDALTRVPVAEQPGELAETTGVPVVASDDAQETRVALERAGEDAPHDDIESCKAQLKPEFAIGEDFYPGGQRVNYGSAVIAVRFTVNAEGETVDDATAVVDDRSNATRPRFLDALARDTVELVRGWEFALGGGNACTGLQEQTAVFRYRSKCVGAPVPRCRTIQSDVMLLDGS